AHHHELNAPAVTADDYFAFPLNSTHAARGCIAAGATLFDTRNHVVHSDVCGTSCATPIAAGTLAVLLSRDAQYQMMAPGRARAVHALNQLDALCKKLSFPAEIQGLGCPNLDII